MKEKITNNQILDKKIVDGIRARNILLRIPNVEYRTETKNNVLYFGLKLVCMLMVVFFLSAGFSKIGSTVSYFNDVEKTLGNFMQADPLIFNVEIASSTSVQVDLSKVITVVMPVMTPGPDSENIQYFVKSEITNGDAGLCNSVRVTATWPFPYDSNIANLITGTTTTTGAWTLELSVPDSSLFINKNCTVDLLYEGWNADAEYGKGYKDKHKVSLIFSVPDTIPIPVKLVDPVILEEEISSTTVNALEVIEPILEENTSVVPEVSENISEAVEQSILPAEPQSEPQ